jgi:putative ABC transport system substrate-binding protein
MLLIRIGMRALVALGVLAAWGPPEAEPQQPAKIPRVGILNTGAPATNKASLDAFRLGLRELGRLEGQNIVLEFRYAEGKPERFPDLVAELVRLKPDVLVGGGTPATRALRDATTTIPIVMAASADAIGSGFVRSLARPGGNITGLSFLDTELSAKRLELLKEALSRVSRVAALMDSASPRMSLDATLAASRPLGIHIQVLEVQGPNELDTAMTTAKKNRTEAMSVLASPTLFVHRKAVVTLAAKHRLPTIYQFREFVEEGGLMSYGANIADMYRRAATYVDKILKGAKPADLPVEQPTRFELVVNLKTAKALGLTIPQAILIRADQVIQ